MRPLPSALFTMSFISALWIMIAGLFYDPISLIVLRLAIPFQVKQIVVGLLMGVVIGLAGGLLSYQLIRATSVALAGVAAGWFLPHVVLSYIGIRLIPFSLSSFMALTGLIVSIALSVLLGKLKYAAPFKPPPPRRVIRRPATQPTAPATRRAVSDERIAIRIEEVKPPQEENIITPPPATKAESRQETGEIGPIELPPVKEVPSPIVEQPQEPPRQVNIQPMPQGGPQQRAPNSAKLPTLQDLSAQEKRAVEVIAALELKEIIPVQDVTSTDGGKYPQLEDALRMSSTDVSRVLQSLAAKNIVRLLRMEFKTITCPYCSSALKSSDFVCRKCGSPNIERQRVLRHAVCGYVGPEGMFRAGGSGLVCPRCKETIYFAPEVPSKSDNQLDVRVYSLFYRCLDCGEISSEPLPIFRCFSCGRNFDVRNFGERRFYRYVVNEEAMSILLASQLPIRELSKALREMGYDVSAPASVKGTSGVIHKLDMLVSKDGINLLGIFVASNPDDLTVSRVMNLAVLKLDTGIPKLVLIVVQRLDEEALKMAEFSGLEVIDMNFVKDFNEEVIKPLIASILRQRGTKEQQL